MITAGIKEIKNNLSRYLLRVKAGEEVLITDRGKPVARLIREAEKELPIRDRLRPLIQSGAVIFPVQDSRKTDLKPVVAPGKPVSEVVIEDRR